MSLQSNPIGLVPTETIRIAQAAFPKGTLCMRLRDILGTIYTDDTFADLFSSTGRPVDTCPLTDYYTTLTKYATMQRGNFSHNTQN